MLHLVLGASQEWLRRAPEDEAVLDTVAPHRDEKSNKIGRVSSVQRSGMVSAWHRTTKDPRMRPSSFNGGRRNCPRRKDEKTSQKSHNGVAGGIDAR